ncbi:MAG TPA: glycosyltransferase family 4 protein [Chloroflexota bacterium]|nr:glycosyltransferase family 4 protein [Chloroflexota bacterium]
MNIVVVTKYPPRSEGISDYGQHLSEALAQRPEVRSLTILADQTGESTQPSRAPAVRRVWSPNDPLLVQRITRELLRLRPDAVWFNVSLAMFGDRLPAIGGFLLPAISRRLGARTVVTLHEFPHGRLSDLGVGDGPIRRAGVRTAVALLHRADVVCVTIAGGRRRPVGRDTSDPCRILHVPLCGYSEPTLEPFGGEPTILVLTSHAPHKNVPFLLTAFQKMRLRVPDARLVLAGIDHPRFPGFLSQLRETHGDQPGVEWRGPVATPDIRDLFRRSRIVVAPYSVATGSSATIHQAIGFGRPAVVTDLPEFRSMAQEEDLWLEFFPRNDSDRLADALLDLASDNTKCGAIARYNLNSAKRHSLAATTDIYLRLLAGTSEFPSKLSASSLPSGARWQSTYPSS